MTPDTRTLIERTTTLARRYDDWMTTDEGLEEAIELIGEGRPLLRDLLAALPQAQIKVWTVAQACGPDAPFEYDQGDVVLVNYDELYDLVHPRAAAAPPAPDARLRGCGPDLSPYEQAIVEHVGQGSAFGANGRDYLRGRLILAMGVGRVIEALRASEARLYPDVGYEEYLDRLTGDAANILEECQDEHVAAFIRQTTETLNTMRSVRDELRRDLTRIALAAVPCKESALHAQAAEIEALRALAAKWRDEADGVTASGYSQQGDRMRDCADELEASLRAHEPEGVCIAETVCANCGQIVCKPGCDGVNPIGGDY